MLIFKTQNSCVTCLTFQISFPILLFPVLCHKKLTFMESIRQAIVAFSWLWPTGGVGQRSEEGGKRAWRWFSLGLPQWLIWISGDPNVIPGSTRSPGEGTGWLPIPVFLPEESHEQGSLVGCSPRGCKELGMTERLILTTLLDDLNKEGSTLQVCPH